MKTLTMSQKHACAILLAMGLAGAFAAQAMDALPVPAVSGENAGQDASAAFGKDFAKARNHQERADKPSIRLRYGEPVEISGHSGTELHYWMRLNSGRSNPRVAISGTVNADVYMKRGSAPTTTDFDCSSRLGSSDKSCSLKNFHDGTYYVMVLGSREFHGKLEAHWDSVFPE